MLSAQEQKSTIKTLIDKNKLEVGGQCFVIARSWYDTWKTYVGFDSTAGRSKYTPVRIPSAINNSLLFYDDTSSIRSSLFLGMDYEILPVPAGKKLVEWYGGGPEIIRDLVKPFGFGFSKPYEVELHPYELCFYRSSNLSDPVLITLKKSVTIVVLKKRIAQKFGLEVNGFTLHNFQSKIKGLELGSTITYLEATLESTGLVSGASVLIDEKDHPYATSGSFSLEKKHIPVRHTLDSPPLIIKNAINTKPKAEQKQSNNIAYYDATNEERNKSLPNPLRELQDSNNKENQDPMQHTENMTKENQENTNPLQQQNQIPHVSAPRNSETSFTFPPNIYLNNNYKPQRSNSNENYSTTYSSSFHNNNRKYEPHPSETPPTSMDLGTTTYTSPYSHTNNYSNSYSQASSYSWSGQNEKGLCGLSNMGNTCYMNSALQCLARIPSLTDYFAQVLYKKEINRTNPLGLEGKIAESFAAVLGQMRQKNTSEFTPREFANTIRQFAKGQFEAGIQHDANELLACVLDGLHEDLNRVKKKPMASLELKPGVSDEIVAKQMWEVHLQRNDSIIVDLLQGQLRNSISCPNCKTVSLNFEPFMVLSLPLQAPIVEYVLILDVVYSNNQRPEKHGILVHQEMPITLLKKKVAEAISISTAPEHVFFAIVKESVFTYYFREEEKLPTQSEASGICAFVVLPPPPEIINFATIPTTVVPVVLIRSNVAFGRPFLIFFPTCPVDFEILLMCIALHVQRYIELPMYSTRETIRAMKSLVTYVYQEDVKTKEQITVLEDQPVELRPHSCLVVSWSSQEMHAHYNYNGADSIMTSNTAYSSSAVQKERPPANLNECISLFTREEKLANEDAWHCQTCKVNRRAIKKLDFWKLPKVLVLQLKRFLYSMDQRGKIEFMVEFPITGLDLSSYVVGPKTSPLVYDLFAVCNHYGTLQSGHYTAYAKFKDEWYLFDDSRCTAINQSNVMTSAAYMLFYVLRDEK